MSKEKLFPAQEEDEEILHVIRRHWFTYVIFWFVAFIMLIPVFLISFYYANNNQVLSDNIGNLIIIGLSAYLLIIMGLMIYGFIDYYLDVYILTDRRIVDIKQNGLFNRAISELNLRQVQDVNACVDGVFPTLLHYGDVLIQTAGTQENFSFQSIPHPYEMSKKIIDLHEKYLQTIETNIEVAGKLSAENDKVTASLNNSPVKKINMSDESKKKLLEGINTTLQEQGQLEEGKKVDI